MKELAGGKRPTFLDILRNIDASGLFEIPGSLKTLISSALTTRASLDPEDEDDRELRAWEACMNTL